MAKVEKHKWVFKARFRRGAFGWRSKPAIERVKEAVSEIKMVRRKEPVLASEGVVVFLEKVSPALEHVDSSSGAIGTAVNRAARDFLAKRPDFALGAGFLALHWLVQGYGYEITSADVCAAYDATMEAARRRGNAEEVESRIRDMVGAESHGERFVSKILGRQLGLDRAGTFVS